MFEPLNFIMNINKLFNKELIKKIGGNTYLFTIHSPCRSVVILYRAERKG